MNLKCGKRFDGAIDLVSPNDIFSNHWKGWSLSGNATKILEDEVKKFRVEFDDLVISPIDKLGVDGIFICPVVYANAASTLASAMEPLNPLEVENIHHRIYRQGERFHRLPYCRLRKSVSHMFAILKAWPKFKSLKEFPSKIEDIKWRPIMGYANHHWKRLLSMLGKLLIVPKVLGWGFSVEAPRRVVEKIENYNARRKSTDNFSHGLEIKSLDIKEFLYTCFA